MGDLAQLLSESCSNYNINAEGLSQVSTPGGPGSNPTWDPASPSTPNRYFNCKGSEIRKLKVRARLSACVAWRGVAWRACVLSRWEMGGGEASTAISVYISFGSRLPCERAALLSA